MDAFKIYLKCIIANKALMLGWLFIASDLLLVIVLWPIDNEGDILFILNPFLGGLFLLMMTGGGMSTYRAYIRSAEHIKRFGDTEELKVKYSREYCAKVGYRLATREIRKIS